jgi:hypothetical protein
MARDSLPTRRLTGDEPFHAAAGSAGFAVRDFWRWAASELAGNTLRGVLAEFLVARSMGLDAGFRTEWASTDLVSPEGIRIEVKSAAYAQVWAQKKPSAITFGIAPTRGWDAGTGKYDTAVRRQADVYVFAILGRPDTPAVDPLDLDSWEFLVLATHLLDERRPTQKTIALAPLLQLGPDRVRFPGLADAVRRAWRTRDH